RDAVEIDYAGRVGAEGGTRTPTGCPTRPSNVRVCQFRHFGDESVVSIPSARTGNKSSACLAQSRIERVTDALAEEVVRQHGDEDGEAGIDGEPPADLDGLLAFVQDVAAGRVRRRHADAEGGQPGLGQDGGGNAGRHGR